MENLDLPEVPIVASVEDQTIINLVVGLLLVGIGLMLSYKVILKV